jgi:hypothetical protein
LEIKDSALSSDGEADYFTFIPLLLTEPSRFINNQKLSRNIKRWTIQSKLL